MTKGVSVAAYARSRKERGLPGGSRWAVQKALREGRIAKEPDGTIDAAKADRDWNANTSEAKRHEPVVASPSTFQEARAVREALNVRLTKLEYDQKRGELVRVEEVQKEAFRRWRVTRDRLLAVPHRVGPAIAATDDAKEVERILTKAFEEALEELTTE